MNDVPRATLLGRIPSIDARGDAPLHAQIRRALRDLINEHFEDGDRFFTEPELVTHLGASRGTVRRALADLSRDGLLDRHMAKGSFVRKRELSMLALMTVKVFVPDWNSPYLASMVQGVSNACRKIGHRMEVYHTHREDKVVDIAKSVENSTGSEGVLLLNNIPQTTRDLYELLTDKGCRTVNVGALVQDFPGPSVNIANAAVVRLSLDHLTALGHRRIVFLLNEPEASGNVAERKEAFLSLIQERSLSEARLVSCRTQYFEDSYAKAYETMHKVFNDGPAPTAIFTHSDPGAWAALRWLADNNIRVPGKVSVMGFSDDRPSQFTYPQLTTLAQPVMAMTARAVAMLTEKPSGHPKELFMPTLVVRESTGPVATG